MRRTEAVVRRLRRDCAFNASRVPRDLIDALVDEVDELKEAIERGADWDIVDELGDVLFSVLSLAAAIEDAHGVSLDDADEHSARKMTGRHPYVFDDVVDPGPEAAMLLWNERKRAECSERVENRTAVVGTGTAVLPAESAEAFAGHLAETLTQSLAPFEKGTEPAQATHNTADGRSATIWTLPGGRVSAYFFIGGPATSPEAVSTALPLAEHATHLREVPRV